MLTSVHNTSPAHNGRSVVSSGNARSPCVVHWPSARERGITKFRAEALRSNKPVKALLRELDGTLQRISADGGVVVYEVHLPDVAGLETTSSPLFRFLKERCRFAQTFASLLPPIAIWRPRSLREGFAAISTIG